MNSGIPMIRVKEFARCENPQAEQNETLVESKSIVKKCMNEIETISLSSEEDVKLAVQKPKSKPKYGERKLTQNSITIRNRTPKPPLQYKYHKISEYFQTTKKDCKYI